MYHVLLLNSGKKNRLILCHIGVNLTVCLPVEVALQWHTYLRWISFPHFFHHDRKMKNNRARVVINVAIKWEGKTDQLEGGK